MKKYDLPTKKQLLIILVLSAAVTFPIILLMLFTAPHKSKGGADISREYLTGCILAQMKSTGVPDESIQEGINAAACAILTSLRFLSESGADGRKSFPCVEYMSGDEATEYYGENAAVYLKCAETAADYALTVSVTKGGKSVFLPVCRISSGVTVELSQLGMPWVKRVQCRMDKEAAGYAGGCQLSEDGFSCILLTAFSEIVLPPDRSEWITDITTDSAGNVLSLNVCGITLSGWEFRRLFSLRSVCFEVSYSSGVFTFTTNGDGDGAGLSVHSACLMSRNGSTAAEILQAFFDVDITQTKR